MSSSHSPTRRPAAICSFIFGGSVLAFLVVLPVHSTLGQDQQPAASPAAPADAPQGEDPKVMTGPAPESPAAAESEPSEAAPEPTPAEPTPAEPTPAEPTADPEWVAKGVWTLPPTEGAAATDFALVGEYAGDLQGASSPAPAEPPPAEPPSAEPLPTEPASAEPPAVEPPDETAAEMSEGRRGVQIRNLGDGEFEARVYQGGLPGQDGFQNEEPMVLLGRRSGETLVLSGGPWAMFVTPENCKIIDASGTTLATLERVQRQSPTLGAAPPDGAIVLFDGSDTSAFTNGEMNSQGLLTQGADISEMLGDFDLHIEFRIPHMPKLRDQQRGNSGLYLQSRYECQVLDSFGDANVFNGLGALYRYKTPKMNMAFPPLTWQSYDIHFTAARFAADGTKVRNARVTSWVNGVMVQDDEELAGPTGAGKEESPTLLPTKIQDHNDPVRFRNIWVIDRGLTGGIAFPQMAKPAAQE